ncbi:hypothetical protein HNR60_000507 [Rhodopseudomonas rhenobacensis]|uniref:Uncharacterized protein n=1 Tax=Rhodopseudomonas rhenobacensis TaxID=87461 RepID=A0A7W7Z0P0_9BRAD|nr:hypothetical protein [Rhodopseudomonas rhenobacensis]MBB5045772.1 hypothetical protein [Rhodopseudomonas rhenobacensis]
MPLIALWQSNPTAIGESTIEQIVAMAGDGNLRDATACSQEFRQYLSEIPSGKLGEYIDHCLSSSFTKSGMVLQDLVNELGRRLDYKVTNGRYQGTIGGIGYDGIWTSPESHTIISEVKTTDAYRISLDTIVSYREKLLLKSEVSGKPSILIVVGREDTGELEAQIRGSRHAWDIRLISAEALLKLVQLKENSDNPDTGRQIRSLLMPMEYTRLDNMVDVMFATATDVEAIIAEANTNADSEEIPLTSEVVKTGWEFTDFAVIDGKRAEIVDAIGRKLDTKFIKNTRALFWNANHEKRLACSISKRYTKGTSSRYWYAYHPAWDEFLRGGIESYFVLGCVDLNLAFSIPHEVIEGNLLALNTTKTSRKTYWHIHLIETDGGHSILLPLLGAGKTLPVDQFTIQLAISPRRMELGLQNPSHSH